MDDFGCAPSDFTLLNQINKEFNLNLSYKDIIFYDTVADYSWGDSILIFQTNNKFYLHRDGYKDPEETSQEDCLREWLEWEEMCKI